MCVCVCVCVRGEEEEGRDRLTSLISLIFDPPLPIRDPHCEVCTISLKDAATPFKSVPGLLDAVSYKKK